jgi:hypothetical protein
METERYHKVLPAHQQARRLVEARPDRRILTGWLGRGWKVCGAFSLGNFAIQESFQLSRHVMPAYTASPLLMDGRIQD